MLTKLLDLKIAVPAEFDCRKPTERGECLYNRVGPGEIKARFMAFSVSLGCADVERFRIHEIAHHFGRTGTEGSPVRVTDRGRWYDTSLGTKPLRGFGAYGVRSAAQKMARRTHRAWLARCRRLERDAGFFEP